MKSDILVKVSFNYAGTVEVKRSFTILLDGDFDGDGRKDLAIRTGPEAMTMRRGTATGAWETEGTELPIPPVGDAPGRGRLHRGPGRDGRARWSCPYRGPPGGHDRLWVLRTE